MHQSRRRMRDQSPPISPLEQLLRPPLRKVPSGTSMPSAASSTGAAAGSSTTSSPPIGKLPVAGPTSIGHFAVILVMHICRKILLIKTNIKLWTYVLILIVVSVVTDHFPAPRCYFSDKRNILNQYFVKLGWGWTCSLIALLIYFTSNTYCCGNRKSINIHLSRLAVGTAWWYICTNLFVMIHDYGILGFCLSEEPLDQNACELAKKRWVPFDISGHAFLLFHCMLIISEEVKCISGWDRIVEILQKEEQQKTQRLKEEEIAQMKASYFQHTPYIRCVVFCVTLLSIIWDVMLLATIVYFHNMAQKLAGAVFAILGWLLTYKFWYRMKHWTPGLGGQGVLRYVKDSN